MSVKESAPLAAPPALIEAIRKATYRLFLLLERRETQVREAKVFDIVSMANAANRPDISNAASTVDVAFSEWVDMVIALDKSPDYGEAIENESDAREELTLALNSLRRCR